MGLFTKDSPDNNTTTITRASVVSELVKPWSTGNHFFRKHPDILEGSCHLSSPGQLGITSSGSTLISSKDLVRVNWIFCSSKKCYCNKCCSMKKCFLQKITCSGSTMISGFLLSNSRKLFRATSGTKKRDEDNKGKNGNKGNITEFKPVSEHQWQQRQQC